MIAMDQTIAGAASGEIAIIATPKGSQSQAKGQKSTEYYLLFSRRIVTDIICYS